MKTISIIRKEEEKLFSTLTFSGTVVDLGGGKNVAYLKKVQGAFEVVSVNLNHDSNPTILHDLEKTPFPFASASVDVIVCNNTLEHIFHAREVLKESARILKPHGTLVITVPFMIPYHASPHDYWRYTPDALQYMLEEAGYTTITITPLGSGIFTSVFHHIERLLPGVVRAGTQVLHAPLTFLDRVVARMARLAGKKYTPDDYALGFFVVAKQ